MISRSLHSLTLKAPAKVNLFLQVLYKRSDGFHEIQTIFERIDLCDDVTLQSNQTGRIKIRCNHPAVPLGPKNLVHKVATLIQKDFGIQQGVDVTIFKRIPVAAGLAGGSTNAAAVLKGLNRLWGLGLSQKYLVAYGRRIGSDVAFFLYDYPWALGTGRGDEIKRLDIRLQLWHVLVVPRIKIYSAKVYEGLKMKAGSQGVATNILTKRNDNVNILIRHLKKNKFFDINDLLKNDLEPEIIRQCPQIWLLKQRLKSFNIQGVMISGSGPSVYGITDSQEKARQIASVLSRRFSQVFIVKTL